jgi:phenylalanyl-tRNA synthetase alpha subunit
MADSTPEEQKHFKNFHRNVKSKDMSGKNQSNEINQKIPTHIAVNEPQTHQPVKIIQEILSHKIHPANFKIMVKNIITSKIISASALEEIKCQNDGKNCKTNGSLCT